MKKLLTEGRYLWMRTIGSTVEFTTGRSASRLSGAIFELFPAAARRFQQKTMLKFLLWLILFILCWPLALAALVVYPLIWILLDLIAAALALCESEGLSGKDLILSTIIAYEIEMRLCESGRPGVREYGWHHATLSAFAAPVAAGRVLNLTPEQMVSAIGISASRTFCPGGGDGRKVDQHEEHG